MEQLLWVNRLFRMNYSDKPYNSLVHVETALKIYCFCTYTAYLAYQLAILRVFVLDLDGDIR